jgi:flagellar basal-body rod protein FlgG
MKLLRKLLIGAVTAVGVVACLAATVMVVQVCRHLAQRDPRDNPPAEWFGLGTTYGFAFPGDSHEPPGIARVAGFGETDDDDEAAEEHAMAVIDEELREESPEEREVWHAELKGHSPHTIREILSLRRTLSAAAPRSITEGIELTAADAPALLPLPEAGTASASRLSADALGLIESAIEATRAAEQVILNNIANANTVGFKRSRVVFGDLPYRQIALPGPLDQNGRPASAGIALGAGVKLLATQVDVSQGRLRQTGQPLDLAIEGGDGYFQINDGNRFLYTRAGSFNINAKGELVLVSNDRGRPLEPVICVPQDAIKITISSHGNVSVLQAGQTQLNQIGQIQLARFISPGSLLAHGANLFEATTASGNPQVSNPGQDGLGEIQQGCLEEANVVVSDEMAELRRMQEQLTTLRQLQAEFSGASRAP